MHPVTRILFNECNVRYPNPADCIIGICPWIKRIPVDTWSETKPQLLLNLTCPIEKEIIDRITEQTLWTDPIHSATSLRIERQSDGYYNYGVTYKHIDKRELVWNTYNAAGISLLDMVEAVARVKCVKGGSSKEMICYISFSLTQDNHLLMKIDFDW
jgi:hypothetical protein